MTISGVMGGLEGVPIERFCWLQLGSHTRGFGAICLVSDARVLTVKSVIRQLWIT